MSRTLSSSALMRLSKVFRAQISKRPSEVIKSPYVADVILSSTPADIAATTAEHLAHCPSLGCCGLSDKGAFVWMTGIPLKKNQLVHEKCSHSVCLAEFQDPIRNQNTIIGMHPKFAEDLVEGAIKANVLSSLSNVQSYKRESVVKVVEIDEDSRFDYVGVDGHGNDFILEVKNVPLADYEDISDKDKKLYKVKYGIDREFNSKVAYFPDGYRKKAVEAISPRALKHLRTLTHIKQADETGKKRCIICFVIQRADVNRFTPSIVDPEYRQAFYDARRLGVEVMVLQVEWRIEVNSDGTHSAGAYLVRDDLPIVEEHDIYTSTLVVSSESSSTSSKRTKRKAAIATITNDATGSMEDVTLSVTSEVVESREVVKKKRVSKKKVVPSDE